MLEEKYLNANSKYVPESEQEEIDILEGDAKDKEEAARKAEAEKGSCRRPVPYYPSR